MVKIKMYIKTYCPFCRAAERLLDEMEVEYEVISVMENMGEFERVKKKTKCMTVPQIFIDDKFIGGYSDLDELHETGKLVTILMK